MAAFLLHQYQQYLIETFTYDYMPVRKLIRIKNDAGVRIVVVSFANYIESLMPIGVANGHKELQSACEHD